MLIVSWNVNGLRSLLSRGISPCAVVSRSDVVCLQETKLRDQPSGELDLPRGWKAFWHNAARPGYSGTAILSRKAPDEVVIGLGVPDFDCEGRTISARFGDVVVISAYFPNSREGGARLGYKIAFCDALVSHLDEWAAKGCHTLVAGDYNIAHQPIDLARPRENERNPGYLPEERAWMSRFLASGHHDVFRDRYPELAGAYTWWSLRTRARERNIGWRLDYTCVSSGLRSRVTSPRIHADVHGSDHCPVSVRLQDTRAGTPSR